MNLLFALLSTVVASFIWLYLFRILNIFHPAKWLHVMFFFCLGALSTLPLFGLFQLVDFSDFISDPYLDMFLSSALIEEISKMLLLVAGMALIPKLKTDKVNWLLFGACIGLGFGAVENIGYALKYGNWVLHYREILSLTGHALFTGIGAYGIVRILDKKSNQALPWLFAGAFLHGLYNSPSVLVDEGHITDLAGITITFLVYLICVEVFALLFNNLLNHSIHFQEEKGIPMQAIRRSTLTLLVLMQILFLMEYLADGKQNTVGAFLIVSSPLLFIMQVLVARLTALVLVKEKTLDIGLSIPFTLGSPDFSIPGAPKLGLRMRGLPYDESEFLRFMHKTLQVYPLSKRASYFGGRAEVEMLEKVYAKSQILFYKVKFWESEEEVDTARHYYLIPKFAGSNMVGNFRIAALLYRDEAIDSATEDFGTGAFCCWVKIPLEKRRPWWKEFFRLLYARP
ncbi:MAG: PrsW family intramembrane metalloprotease [Bacteroidetes bacterium]|nr:MAG: PrsW family intramembrane metalloprotease [Bacteroidota bacterium]